MNLEPGFERKLQEAVLDDVEQRLVGEQGNLIYRFIERVHANLRSYGRRQGYDVEPAIESLEAVAVDRTQGRLSITVTWADEQMGRWEFGVSPHTIDGNPILSFIWEDPPGWVREEFDQARDAGGQFASGWRVFFPSVDHPGIPESRAIRDAWLGLRRVLEG